MAKKKPRGRPRVRDADKLTRHLMIRFRVGEYARIEKFCRKSGVKPSVAVRELALRCLGTEGSLAKLWKA